MAQLVASVSGVVLGGVAMVSLEAKYLQHLSAQLIHYIDCDVLNKPLTFI